MWLSVDHWPYCGKNIAVFGILSTKIVLYLLCARCYAGSTICSLFLSRISRKKVSTIYQGVFCILHYVHDLVLRSSFQTKKLSTDRAAQN